MIFGAHVILSSADAAPDREFLRDLLGSATADAGGGWLICALPAAEVAVHPSDGPPGAELYLLCDDVDAEAARFEARGARCEPLAEARWGRHTVATLPGGARVGLYRPAHPLALARESPEGGQT